MSIYFLSSSRFALLATKAAARSAEFSPDAYTALVFSALWVEALANEILHLAATSPDTASSDPLARLRVMADAADLGARDARLDVKVQVISAALADAPFDRGRQPFQDFHLLILLRNHLVHHRPETLTEVYELEGDTTMIIPERLHPRIDSLVARGIIPEPDREAMYSLNSLLESPAVARWAVDAASAMIRGLLAQLPADHRRAGLLAGYRVFPELAAIVGAA